MRSLALRPIPVLLTLASLTLVACDEATDPTVTGPGMSLPSAEAPIPITTCTVITQPGVYVMDFGIGGVHCPGPVIDIRVSNVTIRRDQLGGVESSAGPCITAGVGVPGGVSRIRLIGVDLRDCYGPAILFENVSSSVVEHATIWWNYEGIVIRGDAALSRADTVRNSDFFGNSGGTITVSGPGSEFILSDNTVEGTQYDWEPFCGVTLSADVTRSVIRRNSFRRDCGLAVFGHRNSVVSNDLNLTSFNAAITVGGQRNVVGENRVRAGVSGIYDGGAYNTLRGNTVEGANFAIDASGRFGLITGNTVQNAGYGILVSGFRTRVNGNRVLNNGETGIRVYANLGAVIAENTVLNNAGLDLDDWAACGANTWRRNVFGTASAPCIH